jgi:hypothetical protein
VPWSLIPQIFYDLIAQVHIWSLIVITGYMVIIGPNAAIKDIFTIPARQGKEGKVIDE